METLAITPNETVRINPPAFRAMIASAARAHPAEACGLLLGYGKVIVEARSCANVAADPLRHFEIDPAALISAHRNARNGGPKVLGYFHSHPNGLAQPSPTDQRRAARDGLIWVIIAAPRHGSARADRLREDVSMWLDAPSGFERLSYRCTQG